MTGHHVELRRGTGADAAGVAALVAEAFHRLPPSEWLVPDHRDRPGALAGYFHVWVAHALTHGHVDLLVTPHPAGATITGAAVWFHRHQESAPEPADYHRRLLGATGRHAARFARLDATFDHHHPTEPHHHLAFLAVHPLQQRTGLGARLLQAHHARLDHHGVPAYLEAASERNHRYYRRHAYRVLGGAPFRLPDDGPPMWPMWRPPHPPPNGRAELPAPRKGAP